MRGLLTKDLMLLRNQWKTLAMICFIGIVIAVTQEPGAIIAYLPLIATMLGLGTLSYDEADNGYSYLFTLPASRRAYVREKYIFSVGVVVLMLVLSVLACVIIMMLASEPPRIDWNEVVLTAGTIFAFAMLLLAVEIPLRLKYGVEKGKIALYVMFGVLAICGVVLARLFPAGELASLGSRLALNVPAIMGAAVLVALVLLALSALVATNILQQKEF